MHENTLGGDADEGGGEGSVGLQPERSRLARDSHASTSNPNWVLKRRVHFRSCCIGAGSKNMVMPGNAIFHLSDPGLKALAGQPTPMCYFWLFYSDG
eukprot:4287381-Amphidinium_carterae.1